MTWDGLFDGINTEFLAGVTEAMPVALSILGVVIAIGFGFKLFYKAT